MWAKIKKKKSQKKIFCCFFKDSLTASLANKVFRQPKCLKPAWRIKLKLKSQFVVFGCSRSRTISVNLSWQVFSAVAGELRGKVSPSLSSCHQDPVWGGLQLLNGVQADALDKTSLHLVDITHRYDSFHKTCMEEFCSPRLWTIILNLNCSFNSNINWEGPQWK